MFSLNCSCIFLCLILSLVHAWPCDFIVSPNPFWTDRVFELIGTWLANDWDYEYEL